MLKRFRLLGSDGNARRGEFTSAHGSFQTPNFMPVGTRGTVRGVDAERLRDVGAQIMLVNTYHLWLRPGSEVVARLGGIHRFSGWHGPILSDSGGFQIFSLKGLRRLQEEGVEFQSHIDGSRCFLSPEKAVAVQEELGVDIAMVLDECPAGGQEYIQFKNSLELTLRWAKRCLAARQREDMALFGITQGGVFRDLRTHAAESLAALEFDGLAVGGLSVGESKESMYDVLSWHPAQLPEDRIRYLMGVGTPEDIVEAVRGGIDLFDCVIPTRAGRFGRAYVSGEEPSINIKNAEHQTAKEPLDKNCACLACRNYSRGYLNHLFKVNEMLGPQLLSVHNLAFYLAFMGQIRDAISSQSFEQFYAREKARWKDVEAEGLTEGAVLS